ncbi:hypothetical protein Pelo_16330 [Pelomyxa schiedti]|nr:hypothetical protein Pelo_16330 [Pelomyxa schiedti]
MDEALVTGIARQVSTHPKYVRAASEHEGPWDEASEEVAEAADGAAAAAAGLEACLAWLRSDAEGFVERYGALMDAASLDAVGRLADGMCAAGEPAASRTARALRWHVQVCRARAAARTSRAATRATVGTAVAVAEAEGGARVTAEDVNMNCDGSGGAQASAVNGRGRGRGRGSGRGSGSGGVTVCGRMEKDHTARNRRFKYMHKLAADSYFDEDQIKMRYPHLYEQYIGQYLPESKKAPQFPPEMPLSDRLLNTYDYVELEEQRRNQESADKAQSACNNILSQSSPISSPLATSQGLSSTTTSTSTPTAVSASTSTPTSSSTHTETASWSLQESTSLQSSPSQPAPPISTGLSFRIHQPGHEPAVPAFKPLQRIITPVSTSPFTTASSFTGPASTTATVSSTGGPKQAHSSFGSQSPAFSLWGEMSGTTVTRVPASKTVSPQPSGKVTPGCANSGFGAIGQPREERRGVTERVCSLTVEEQFEQRRELVRIAQEKFLNGEDAEEFVDYTIIDCDESLDDIDVINQDAEELYFDTDSE